MFVRRVFLPFALGYFLSQLLRSVNAVVASDLIREFSLDAWTVGFLTSAYFLAFAGAQIPIGVALDRYGPRRTESVLLLFAAAGALAFGFARSTAGLAVGRGLIGLGVSACLMASFHAFVLWAPGDRLPFLNGAVMASGALGSLAATSPVEWLVGVAGWRQVFVVLTGFTLAVAAVLFTSTPEPQEPSKERLSDVVRGVGKVFGNRGFWSVAPLSIAHQGTYLAIQSLWAGPWLRDVAHLDRVEVASHLLTLACGMALGFLGLGFVADRLGKRGITPLSVWLVAAVLFQATQGAIVHGTSLTASSGIEHARLLWFGFGFFGASGMFGYVILTRRFSRELAGRVNAGLNVLVFTSAFVLQAGIGAVIDRWSPLGTFSAAGYQWAFGLVLAMQGICLLWLLLTTSWRRMPDSGRFPLEENA